MFSWEMVGRSRISVRSKINQICQSFQRASDCSVPRCTVKHHMHLYATCYFQIQTRSTVQETDRNCAFKLYDALRCFSVIFLPSQQRLGTQSRKSQPTNSNKINEPEQTFQARVSQNVSSSFLLNPAYLISALA